MINEEMLRLEKLVNGYVKEAFAELDWSDYISAAKMIIGEENEDLNKLEALLKENDII